MAKAPGKMGKPTTGVLVAGAIGVGLVVLLYERNKTSNAGQAPAGTGSSLLSLQQPAPKGKITLGTNPGVPAPPPKPPKVKVPGASGPPESARRARVSMPASSMSLAGAQTPLPPMLPPVTLPPLPPSGPVTGGLYRNPFRSAKVSPERIDMGVDYAGTGPIYALGPGVITESGFGWAGAVGAPTPGAFITEKLSGGPLKGKYVYAAEDIIPAVRVGQKVSSSTVLGRYTGAGQSEFGFAVGPTSPSTTLAEAAGQAASGGDPGANTTAFGAAFSRLLHLLGAPAGIKGGPFTGSVPPGFLPSPASLKPAHSQLGMVNAGNIAHQQNIAGRRSPGLPVIIKNLRLPKVGPLPKSSGKIARPVRHNVPHPRPATAALHVYHPRPAPPRARPAPRRTVSQYELRSRHYG